jgi:predicted Zn-dependent protease
MLAKFVRLFGHLLALLASAGMVTQPVLAQAADANAAAAQPAPTVQPAPPAPAPTPAPADQGPVVATVVGANDEVVPDYEPQDKDERGLWMQMENAERELKNAPVVIRDPELNAYVRSVFCKTVGLARCTKVRIYLVRTDDFNASMTPNGAMQVWSGLLLRTRNEAQLAAVLGHEYVHFEKRHSLKLFRDVRSKSNSMVFLSFLVGGLIASLLVLPSIFHHSREMEEEADMHGMNYVARAGYDTREAAKIWEQLREEMDATAAVRKTKSRKDKDGGMFATHPPTKERVAYLTAAAAKTIGTPGNTGEDSYSAIMSRYWPQFVEDQLKLNDFGGTDYLIESMMKAKPAYWLSYARGELYRRRADEASLQKALSFFDEGIAANESMPELWRGRGLARLKLGQSEEGKADLREYLRRQPEASDKGMIAMMAGGQQ